MIKEINNERRSEDARRAIFNSPVYGSVAAIGNMEEAITELMTDCLHLASHHDIDIEILLERIAHHHRDEE